MATLFPAPTAFPRPQQHSPGLSLGGAGRAECCACVRLETQIGPILRENLSRLG